MITARTRLIAITAILGAASCSERSAPSAPGPAQAPAAPLAIASSAVPPGCVAAIAPASAIVPASGATRAIAVKAPPGCAWQAEIRGSFLHVTSAAGQGEGSVTVTIDPSTAASPRAAMIAIGGKKLSVFQDGARALVHPRLWMDPEMASELKAWARDDNPVYKSFHAALDEAEKTFDTRFSQGKWADNGGVTFTPFASEAYAEMFAFASLIAPSSEARTALAGRARALLMFAIDKAAEGPKAGEPFRDPGFGNGDRSGFWGEGFGLTVDWIYPSLSAEDKAKIRAVFLRWAASDLTSANAPQLIDKSKKKALRWAANNYYLLHLRNLTLMSLALDPADDEAVDPGKPRGALGNSVESYFGDVTSAWIPRIASLLGEGGDASGGLPPEGILYGTAMGALHQALLAMRTAGRLDDAGARLLDGPFWDRFLAGFVHSIAPSPRTMPGAAYLGPVYPVASYGDVLRTWAIPEWINILGSLGIDDARMGRSDRARSARFLAENLLEGGPDKRADRVAKIWGNSRATSAILSFMLFDPGAPPPVDPRPRLPLTFFDRSIGRILARTSWDKAASLFAFSCGWKSINHQIGDAGQIDLYRRGEWLTKELSGYASHGIISTTDYHNTLSLENDRLAASAMVWFEPPINQRGSQYLLDLGAGDPSLRAASGAGFVHAEAEMTPLYNRAEPHGVAPDIALATRSVVWIQPDLLVVYDRATSKTAGRFKRFNLMLPGDPTIAGRRATAKTALGQQVFVTSILPARASLSIAPLEKDNVAEGETMRARLVVEDPGRPADVRFLHVIEGADAGAAPGPADPLTSSGDPPFDGAIVRGAAVLFPVQPIAAGSFKRLSYTAPSSTRGHLVTGLPPGRYDVAEQRSGGAIQIRITPGSQVEADEAGAIAIGSFGETR